GATGIYLSGAPVNLIRRNRIHHNDDSGLEIQNGSDDCLSIQNLSWANGDHGFEHLFATGTLDIGDVAWGNHTDGFSVEGRAAGTEIIDCIGTENGLDVNGSDLYVDPGSTAGFTSDYNAFWNPAGTVGPVRYNGVRYATLPAFTAATGLDSHSIQADPRFTNAGVGNFEPLAGSPVIAAGTSDVPNGPATDFDGSGRIDIPSAFNTGAGPIPYSDIGAYEVSPSALAVDGDPNPGLRLSSATPNPCRGAVGFVLELPADARVSWGIYDLQGRRLWGEERPCSTGHTVLAWPGSAAVRTAGLYFARFQVAGRSLTRRFVLMR